MVLSPQSVGHFSQEQSVAREFDRFTHHLLASGRIRNWRVEYAPTSRCTYLTVLLPTNEWVGFTLTDDELYMGGQEALHHWLDTVFHDISRRIPCRSENWEEHQAFQALRQNAVAFESLRQRDWDDILRSNFDNADERARGVFKLVAGQATLDVLDSGKALPLKGSEGTDYTLHKRATYCVERPRDGARLCAVVPGVPLWDHLLGIKLMVEHDEPQFLKIANVASEPRPAWFNREAAGY